MRAGDFAAHLRIVGGAVYNDLLIGETDFVLRGLDLRMILEGHLSRFLEGKSRGRLGPGLVSAGDG